MIEAVAVRDIVSGSQSRVVVLMHMALLAPFLQEELIRLLRELSAHCWVIVVAQPQVREVVHRSPDSSPPVVLIAESRAVSRNRRNHPLAPEFLGVQQVFLYHRFRLFGGCRFGQHWIKVGRRKPHAGLSRMLLPRNPQAVIAAIPGVPAWNNLLRTGVQPADQYISEKSIAALGGVVLYPN